jgi:hypothetical protein
LEIKDRKSEKQNAPEKCSIKRLSWLRLISIIFTYSIINFRYLTNCIRASYEKEHCVVLSISEHRRRGTRGDAGGGRPKKTNKSFAKC